METFLTVKEAAKLCGRSASSVRRIIYPIVAAQHHADRSHIQPTEEEVRQLRVRGDNFAWRISEELLRRELPAEAAVKSPRSTPEASASRDQEDLLALLRSELDIKNRQIAQQMELIQGLTERMREGNILLGSLQQQQQRNLTAGPSQPPHANVVEESPAPRRFFPWFRR